MSGEFDLIDKIRESLGDQPTSLVDLGIGDDCAIIRQPPDQLRWLVTTDMLMQGRHFDLTNDPEQLKSIGQKAIAVNISDIAAMAGTPVAAFVSVALPMESAVNSARFLTEGMRLESEKFQISLAGGDTNFWSGPLVINVTLTGYEPEGGAVLRSGAKVGDLICVSGPLGGSLPSGRHLRPEPRIRFAQELKRRLGPCLHAMIDISDGLAGDLRHILAESGGLGAQLVASQIPVHQDVLLCHPETADNLEQQLAHAMGDGEDFELCFCFDPDSSENDLPEGSRIIGKITEVRGIQILWPDGKVKPWTGSGFDHGRSPVHKIPSSGSGRKCNSMKTLKLELDSEEQTLKLGEMLANLAGPGDVIALVGDLGSGKTTFTRGFARALGVSENQVTSPTYLLQQEYLTAKGFLIHHFDVYRLDDPDQFEDLGVGETFDSGGISVVEWADRAPDSIPRQSWWIRFSHKPDGDGRSVELQIPENITVENLITK